MPRYYEMREYDCLADYYEDGNLGSVPPRAIAERRHRESDERQRERNYVSNKTYGMGVNE